MLTLQSTLVSIVELSYDVMEGNELIVSLQTSFCLGEVCGKIEGEVFQNKIQACRHIT